MFVLDFSYDMVEKITCPVADCDCPYCKADGSCGLYPKEDPEDRCSDYQMSQLFFYKDDNYFEEV